MTSVECLKNASGKLVVDENGIKETWKQHIERLMNEENDRETSRNLKQDLAACIHIAEVIRVLKQTKADKASGKSGVHRYLV